MNDEEKKMIICMNHIPTDGVGFLQYLYLLASLYNGHSLTSLLENCRDISPVLRNIHIRRPTQQTRRTRHITVAPLRENSSGKQYFCLCSRIMPKDFSVLYYKKKAKCNAQRRIDNCLCPRNIPLA